MNSPSLASNKDKKEKKTALAKKIQIEKKTPQATKIQIEKKDSILIEQSPLPQSVESEKEELKSSSDYSVG